MGQKKGLIPGYIISFVMATVVLTAMELTFPLVSYLW